MCGIFGFHRTSEFTNRMTPTLAIMMAARGRDSWGVTDGEYFVKMKGSIEDNFIDMEWNQAVYHTRAASVGAVSDRNAHPFEVITADKRVIGVHNGHIHNHYAIKEKYNRTTVEVDSEHIFMHLAEGRDLGEIGGWGAVVWYEHPVDHPEDRVLHMSKFNGDNLHVVRLKGGEIVFASTESAIKSAMRYANAQLDKLYKIEPNKHYFIQGDELMLAEEELPWGKNPLTFQTHSNTHSTDHNGSGYGGFTYTDRRRHYSLDTCAINDCHTVVADNELVCNYHYRRAAAEVSGELANRFAV